MVSVGLWFVMMEAEKHQVSAQSRSTHPLQPKTAGLMVSITRESMQLVPTMWLPSLANTKPERLNLPLHAIYGSHGRGKVSCYLPHL